jgi:uncharacterized phage protein (TIGR02216 family)
MKPFPWAAAMRFGLGTLRLPPRHFWGMTPRELAAALEAQSGRTRGIAPERQRFAEMMEQYPDG